MPEQYTMDDLKQMAATAAKMLDTQTPAQALDQKVAAARIGSGGAPAGSITFDELLKNKPAQVVDQAAQVDKKLKAQETMRQIVQQNIRDASYTVGNTGSIIAPQGSPYVIPAASLPQLQRIVGEKDPAHGVDIRVIDHMTLPQIKMAAESLGTTVDALVKARQLAEESAHGRKQ